MTVVRLGRKGERGKWEGGGGGEMVEMPSDISVN